MVISPPRILRKKLLKKSTDEQQQQESSKTNNPTNNSSTSSYLFLQQQQQQESSTKRRGNKKSVTFDPTIGADFESSNNSSDIQQLEAELANLQQMFTEKMHLKECLTAELHARNETDGQVALVEQLIERQKQVRKQLDMEINQVNQLLEREMDQVNRQIDLEANQGNRKQELEASKARSISFVRANSKNLAAAHPTRNVQFCSSATCDKCLNRKQGGVAFIKTDLLVVAESTRETLNVPYADARSDREVGSQKDESDQTWTGC